MTGRAGHHRREFLRALLAGAVGLPWLETFTPSNARAQAAFPKRFVVMFSPVGTIYDQWLPAGDGEAFSLSAILSPLAAHQRDLVVIAGVDQQGAGGDGHQTAIGGMLTGAGLLPGRFPGVGSPPAGWCEGPSVDQRIAQVIGRDSAFRSLELGVEVGVADNFGRMVYRGPNQPLAPREDPMRVFDEVFGMAALEPAERARRKAQKQSILDHVRGELSRLAREVSSDDRLRLDAHLAYLREVESRIQLQSQQVSSCKLPAPPTSPGRGNDAMPAIGGLQIDLLVLALACGQTRVASLQWSRAASPARFTWLGISDTHHALSHLPDDDSIAREKLVRINTWYARQFSTLISKLKSYREGDGTLFDQCLLLWCNELGKGNVHSRNDAPYVLAGSAGGALETGRLLKYAGNVPHNNLLVSLLNVMGLPDTTFGRPEWCTGPLTGLV